MNDDFDLYSALEVYKLKKIINVNVLHNFNLYNSFLYDNILNFFLLEDLEIYKNIFLVNCNLRNEGPSLYYFFLKKVKLNLINLFVLGYNIKSNLFFNNLIVRDFCFSKDKIFFKNNFGFLVKNANLILFGVLFVQRYDISSLYGLYSKFFGFLKNVTFTYVSQNLVNYSLINYTLNNLSFKNFSKKLERTFSWYVNDLSFESFGYDIKKSAYNFYAGHHVPGKFFGFDLFLPSEFVFERKNVFLNVFNQYKFSDFLITPSDMNLRSFGDIINLFCLSLDKNFFFDLKFGFKNFKLFRYFNFIEKELVTYFFELFYKIFFKYNLKKILFKFLYNFKLFSQTLVLSNNFNVYSMFLPKYFTYTMFISNGTFNNFIFNYYCFDLSSKYSLVLNLKNEKFLKKIYKN